MYKRILPLICLLFVSACITPIHAHADQQAPLAELGGYSADARAARIASLKQQYRIKLDEKERALVAARCSLAQDSLKKVATRLGQTKASRDTTYINTISALIQLKALIEAKQIDTSSIDLLIVSYQQQIVQFDNAVSQYDLSLEDATTLDCTTLPEDFRAALEGVRAARKQVVDAASQIRETTKSNLKTTFDSIILKLQTGSTNGQ